MWYKSQIKSKSSSYVPCDWATGTDAEIVEALQKHYSGEIDITEFWSVGDERIITSIASASGSGMTSIPAGLQIPFVLTEVGGKNLEPPISIFRECAFQVDVRGWVRYYERNTGMTWCDTTFYNCIPTSIRPIFKNFSYDISSYSGVNTTNGYFTFRGEYEIFGNDKEAYKEGEQCEWYKTTSNREKRAISTNGINSNTANYYWLRSGDKDFSGYYIYVTDFKRNNNDGSGYYGYAPFGVI